MWLIQSKLMKGGGEMALVARDGFSMMITIAKARGEAKYQAKQQILQAVPKKSIRNARKQEERVLRRATELVKSIPQLVERAVGNGAKYVLLKEYSSFEDFVGIIGGEETVISDRNKFKGVTRLVFEECEDMGLHPKLVYKGSGHLGNIWELHIDIPK